MLGYKDTDIDYDYIEYSRCKHPWSAEFEADQTDAKIVHRLWDRLSDQERAWVRRIKRELSIPNLGVFGVLELLFKMSIWEGISA